MAKTNAPETQDCRLCRHITSELRGALGHDSMGHRAVNRLLAAGIDTRWQAAQLSDAQLEHVHGLGAQQKARIRACIPPGSADAQPPAASPAQPAGHYSPVALLERLPEQLDVTEAMLTSSASAAPLWLLSALSRTDARIWRHVARTRIAFDAMVREPGWSGAERALIETARGLSGAPSAPCVFSLGDLAALLDDGQWDGLLEALRIRRAGLRGA